MTVGSLWAALVAVNLAAADSRPEALALQEQIKALKKEQEITIKAIKARYGAIKRRDRLNEAELRGERAAIKRQEDVTLALTASPLERRQVQAAYDTLRKYLTGGVKLEQHEVRLLTDHENAQVRQVKALYGARIKQLEQMLRALPKQRGTGKKR
jgi:hypothetical protein